MWRQYLHYEGLDITLQLVIPSGNVNQNAASSLVDNNVTSCMSTDACLNMGIIALSTKFLFHKTLIIFCVVLFNFQIVRNFFGILTQRIQKLVSCT